MEERHDSCSGKFHTDCKSRGGGRKDSTRDVLHRKWGETFAGFEERRAERNTCYDLQTGISAHYDDTPVRSVVVAKTDGAFGQPLSADSATNCYPDSGPAPWLAWANAIGAFEKRDPRMTMNNLDNNLLLRLLYILHRGWVEARLLAQGHRWQQLYDLTDTLELLPSAITRWTPKELQATRENLVAYETRYPESFQYSHHLDLDSPPPPPF